MSDIIAYINLDGKPVSPEISSLHNFDQGYETLVKNNFYGAFRNAKYSQQSLNEIQPLVFSNGKYVLLADARIDDRTSFLKKLGVRDSHQELPDSEIIKLAFEKWGKGCVNQFIGEFAFILFDFESNEIWCARDQLGKAPLHYYKKENTVIIATSVYLIQEFPEVKSEINYQSISDYLSMRHAPNGEGFFKNIHSVLPAHTLTISSSSIQSEKYWEIDFQPLKLSSQEAYNEMLLEILEQIIADGMPRDRKVSSYLSGGLDSSTITAITAKHILGDSEKMDTFTYVPVDEYKDLNLKSRFTNEQPFVEEIGKMHPNLNLNWVTIENCSIFNGLEDVIKYSGGLNIHNYYNSLWVLKIAQLAKLKGNSAILDAQSGNFTLSPHAENRLVELWLKMHWKSLYKELKATSELHSYPISRLFLIKSVRQSLPIPLKNWLDRKKMEEIKNSFFPYIQLGFKNQHNPSNYFFLDDLHNHPLGHPRSWEGLKMTFRLNDLKRGMEKIYGIKTFEPTTDVRLAKFMFSLPNEVLYKNGLGRNLVRQATKGLLPDSVRLNHKKGLQLADQPYLLEKDAPLIREKISEWKNKPEISDVLDFKLAEQHLSKPKEMNSMQGQALSKLVAIATFIEMNT